MIIRKATDGEDNYVLSFYYDLIDQMRDREYRPSWTKGVYPTLEDIHAAIVKSELNLAVEGWCDRRRFYPESRPGKRL